MLKKHSVVEFVISDGGCLQVIPNFFNFCFLFLCYYYGEQLCLLSHESLFILGMCCLCQSILLFHLTGRKRNETEYEIRTLDQQSWVWSPNPTHVCNHTHGSWRIYDTISLMMCESNFVMYVVRPVVLMFSSHLLLVTSDWCRQIFLLILKSIKGWDAGLLFMPYGSAMRSKNLLLRFWTGLRLCDFSLLYLSDKLYILNTFSWAL